MFHATWADVDTQAVVDNLRAVRRFVGSHVHVLLPVKADAYGHGAERIARRVEAAGAADAFGVATVGEALALRRVGVHSPVLKFSPAFADDVDAALAADVTLTVADEVNLAEVDARARESGRRARVHVKVDTGMGRIGVDPTRAFALARRAAHLSAVDVTGVFTHLAAADDPAADDATRAQLDAFDTAVEAVTDGLGHRPTTVHAANSAGVLAHPASHLDLVRPGIMSYGYYPDAATPRTVDIRPALTWWARISHVKTVDAGTRIGYGGTWAAPTRTTVATLPVGYADGLDRGLSNRGSVYAGGRAYPIVGRVCMDQTMVDLGPRPLLGVGDPVTLLGVNAPESADAMAARLHTIAYEVLSRIGGRVPRVG